MLKRILIPENLSTSVYKKGRHINVVLATGIITARIQYDGGEVLETDLISGMAIETEKEFISITFSSETAQQMQIWVSDLPLNYQPLESKAVGSSAVSSYSAEVYSGTARELVAALAGRSKFDIAPSADIVVGGANLTPKNGMPVAAGTVKTISTQGALYGLELTGAYPPSITVDAEETDITAPRNQTGVTFGRVGFVSRLDGDEILLFNSSQSTCYRVLESDFSAVGAFALPYQLLGYNVLEYNETAVYTATSGSIARWVTVDLTDLSISSEDIHAGVGGSYPEYFDALGDKRVTYDVGYLYYSVAGGAFQKAAAVDPNAGSVFGIQIASNGDVLILHSAVISKTTDNGATWSTLPIIGSAKGEHGLAIDTITGNIYYNAGANVYMSSDGGATFAIEVGLGDTENVYFKGGVGIAAGDTNYAVYMPSVGNWVYNDIPNAQTRGFSIATNGKMYIHYSGNLYIIEGKQKLSGGLDVAIMAEVN